MLVSVEVRLKLVGPRGRCAMLVRGNELRRSGRRILIPVGGGLVATSDDLRYVTDISGKLKPGNDLRFSVRPRQQGMVEALYEKLTPGRILGEAGRELAEEAYDERGLLEPHEIAACKFTYLRKVLFQGVSARNETRGRQTLYVVGVVQVRPPGPALARLIALSAADDSVVEFVPPATLRNGGYTEKGSFVPSVYSYLT